MDKLLFYCTKAKPYITYDSYDKKVWNTELPELMLNGKIAVECDCDFVEEIVFTEEEGHGRFYQTSSLTENYLLQYACLKRLYLDEYLRQRTVGYALHLTNVKVFDKPKELSDYGLKEAPQNMCYAYDKDGNRYWLLSIRSKYLDKIIKGEKTIEVRRQILKDLRKLI